MPIRVFSEPRTDVKPKVYYRTGALGAGISGPFNTAMLLHCNGADASTTILDSSVPPVIAVTAHADCQLDTAQYKFGGASLLFDGTGDYAELANSAKLDLGLSDEPFTIDFWMRSSLNATWCVFSRGGGAANDWNVTDGNQYLLQYVGGGSQRFYFYYNIGNATADILGPVISVLDNAWHHVAVIFDGTTTWLAVDGIFGTGVTTGTYTKPTTSATTRIGIYQCAAFGGDYAGHFDEFRISKGIARWTSDFSVPTEEYLTRE